jgi:hypothetical protein
MRNEAREPSGEDGAAQAFAWAIAQKSGTKAIQAAGNKIGARRTANKIAGEKDAKNYDIRII